MLDAIARKEADAVIVHELSRWSRNISVSIQAFKILDNAGATLISLKENIDRSSATGKLFVTMISAFNEFYSDSLGQHMEKARSDRLLKNLHVGQVPFGWRSENGSALVHEAEYSAARKLIAEPFLTGNVSYYDIAASLNAAGWLTRSQKIIKRQGVGGRWSADTVRTYLGRPFIAGYVAANAKGSHAPLVSDEDWQRIQTLIEARRHLRSHPRHRDETATP